MENASKALIIAGAILLAILLISLGIYIFSQAQSVVEGSGMTKAEVSTFNNQFLKYEGSIKGSEVKSLIQEVNVNNTQDESSEKQITLELPSSSSGSTGGSSGSGSGSDSGKSSQTYKTSGIINTSTYTVTIEEYAKDGRITKIKIAPGK